ncbi:MAG: tRNA (adenosine(37)-N6)-dimethylallyltransferase MiaA [Bacteroidia bacterium]|nr:tRNA (adenosine(37)-N6)-dimethylallyltransferase MiaA [Bacteroidia bacterium]
MSEHDCLVVLGPTASGKTKLAVELAGQLNAEIISIDSRMVYKYMNIGTGKDLDEYFYQNKPIPYHLIDICEPNENYHIYQFQLDFKKAFNSLRNQSILPILCGGSGLYLEAVINDFAFTAVPGNEELRQRLDPESLENLHKIFDTYKHHAFKETADLGSKKRAIRAIEIAHYLSENTSFELPQPQPLKPLIIGLNPKVEQRRDSILNRLSIRLNQGLVEEVEHLLSIGVGSDRLMQFGLEYKFVMMYLNQEISLEEMKEKLCIAIQQFAKRQMTYFRKMEKSGLLIHWFGNREEALDWFNCNELKK